MRNWFVSVLVVFAGLSNASLSAQKRAPVIDMHMRTISRSIFPLEPHLRASPARVSPRGLRHRPRRSHCGKPSRQWTAITSFWDF
jgi:hypothetical protein